MDIEIKVYKKLEDNLKKSELRIVQQDRWKTNLLIRRFDIVIYNKSNPFVIIEVKNNLYNKNQLAIGTDQVRSAITLTNARYGIVTDDDRYFFYDKSKPEDDFKELSFEVIIREIDNPSQPKFGIDQFQKIIEIFKKSANKHLPHNNDLKLLLEEDIINKIEFDFESSSFTFKDGDFFKSDIENKIFLTLLGKLNLEKICRYSSFDTIFSMINYESFRLNGIAGMNDKTEINYVDNLLEKGEQSLNSLTDEKVTDINKRFITSCSKIEQKDNLTFWRLYGDDGKGVCMEFQIKKQNIDNNVLIQEVNYAESPEKHSEISFLKEVIEKVEENSRFKFEFKKLDIWKNFFKPYEYSIEEEVRLLIIDEAKLKHRNKGWVKTYSHSILNPFIDFALNDKEFPLELKTIILGPKCLEQQINKLQLQEMVRQKSEDFRELGKIKVNISEIKHYR